ncbi:MAG: DUF1573 domain-containing protein [Bacteroidetes bacterium]|nr:DUF1573 domain-containing protein [Bacteroidota bacterium]
MKAFSSSILVTIGLMAMSFSTLAPGLKFEKTLHNFGDKVKQHQPVSCEFKFTNDGAEPLLITNVKPSCGCTTPEWPKEPIMPGQSGVIKAEYNAEKLGAFHKTIEVTSNATETPLSLTIKGSVIEASLVDTEDKKPPKLELNK